MAGMIGGARFAHATAFQWDGTATPDTNWSTGANWVGDPATGPAAGDSAAFDNIGIANLNNTVDPLQASTLSQLGYRQDDTTKTYATSIDRGATLTLAYTGTISNAAATL